MLTRILYAAQDALDYVLDLAEWVWKEYPARTITVLTSIVVSLAAQVGLVLPSLSVAHTVEVVVPILLGGELIHRRVSPVKDDH